RPRVRAGRGAPRSHPLAAGVGARDPGTPGRRRERPLPGAARGGRLYRAASALRRGALVRAQLTSPSVVLGRRRPSTYEAYASGRLPSGSLASDGGAPAPRHPSARIPPCVVAMLVTWPRTNRRLADSLQFVGGALVRGPLVLPGGRG